MSEPPTNIALAGLDSLSTLSSRILAWASPERSFIERILEAAALESGDRLLDVGCGTGTLLAAAAYKEPGAVLAGIDPDEDALELASRKIRGTVRSVELHQGLGEDLPFADESFDVITVTLVLYPLPPDLRTRILRECLRVLRAGGRLLVAEWAVPEEGLAAVVELPARVVRRLLHLGPEPLRAADAIARAGFHAPEALATFPTVLGSIELLEAYKPLAPLPA